MRNFLICLSISILSLVLLSNVSCADNPDIFKPPAQATNEADPNALTPGAIPKTQGYNFTEGFIFHEWKNQEAIIKYVPFNFNGINYENIIYVGSPTWAIKKLVSSKYFDIYVDCTEGQPTYKKALTVQDKVWDKLIRELEKLYPKIVDIYGEPTDIDGNGKIEIVFHENVNYGMTRQHGGYFCQANVNKGYRNTGNMDIIYINSYYYILSDMKEFSQNAKKTIIHELQHDIEAKRKYESLYCYNEALSESTYPTILDNTYSGRDGNFTEGEIKNGQYFFDWPRNSKIVSENYKTSANFMYWLYLHGGGEKIIRDIVSVSEHKQIDYKSVGEAASRNIPDLKNKNYNTIYAWWYIANFYNNNSGIYGYKGKANISLSLANDPSGKVILKSRCAVYTTQDMLDKNKNIPKIATYELSDSGRNWLLLFNYGSDNRTVYINPSATSRAVRSYSRQKEIELYDSVWYINKEEKIEDNDIPPEDK